MDANYQSLIRDLFKIVGALAVAKGIGDAAAWEMVGGGALTIIGTVWSQIWHVGNKVA